MSEAVASEPVSSPSLTREVTRRAAKALLRRVARARSDPGIFFEMCAREEHTRARLKLLPHQQLLLAFVQAHRRSVIRAFAGASKTYTLGWLGTWLTGRDTTGRGAVIGATAESASKVVGVIRESIADERGEYPELHLVFPHLVPTTLTSEPWTQRRITVDRPAGIRDPSWLAMGIGGALPGARLKWIIVDDVLDEENTATEKQREKLNKNFGRKVVTRLDARDAIIVVVNTPWEPDDLTFQLEKAGWPTLSMVVEGDILWETDLATIWEAPQTLVRPSRKVKGAWRLTAHDSKEYGAPLCEILPGGEIRKVVGEPAPGAETIYFDIDEVITLWPEKFGPEKVASLREDFRAIPGEFAAKYKLQPRAPADEAKKRLWIEQCKANGRALGYSQLATYYRGRNPTFTGIDVAVSKEDGSDLRAIFTFEQIDAVEFYLPNGEQRILRNARRLLNLQSGYWSGAEFVQRIEQEHRNFNSLLRVETNAAQDLLRQWLVSRNTALPIEAHHTGETNKTHRIHGIAGVMIELENLAWIIPCDASGRCPDEVEKWIAEILAYRPDKHPGDRLIASWLAREEARKILGDGVIPVDLASVRSRF